MTVSLRRMSAGAGYRYLLRSVAAGDGRRALSSPLTRYYSEAGTPPGRWMGSGVHHLAAGQLELGTQVSEQQLALLLGLGRDPVTGIQLGRAYATYDAEPTRDRMREPRRSNAPTDGVSTLGIDPAEGDSPLASARHAVAGYDLTFSVPKSVSVLWGLGDAPLQEQIVAAHHGAMSDVLDYFERQVAATRTGFADADAAVAQVEVLGVTAVAFDHYDSRAGDPQLHTHLVVSNKVKTALDSRWRSLDGRPVHASLVALSEMYNAVLADRLTHDLGVRWELRERGADRNPQWEIAGVGEALIEEFSSRSRDIDKEKDRLIAQHIAAHGRRPSARTIVELRARATLATRPPKEIRSLADLTAEWQRRARPHVDVDLGEWTESVHRLGDPPPGLAAPTPLTVAAIGADVATRVQTQRSTWTRWNLLAEASRQTMHLRFISASDREALINGIVEEAIRRSVLLTPPELAPSPAAFRRTDATSVFRPRHGERYSSMSVLEAEARLLDRAAATTAPRLSLYSVSSHGRTYSRDLTQVQLNAMRAIASSGRQVDLLVGPAGAGKTRALEALTSAWIVEYGRGSVVGLAPSAAAAQTLGDALHLSCDNTAKWLHDFGCGAVGLEANQLVIIDEASLASTVVLDRVAGVAAAAGAKVLLVGDAHQLQSVDAGGAFALLVERRGDAPELTEIHRFTHAWERQASLRLREGDPTVIGTYARRGRLRDGDTEEMLDAAYLAWRTDTHAGRDSVLVSESSSVVRALNERARAERLVLNGASGSHAHREVHLADDIRASVGDLVITRANNRNVKTRGRGWVKNGDRWRITDVRRDGSVVVQRDKAALSECARLPGSYVRSHLDLGYAITAHRAQGITVDTSHVIVTSSTTRENFYVSMSRGRQSNVAYVALDQPDETHRPPTQDEVTARSVLYGVLQHARRDTSAHQALETELETCNSVSRLAAELETIAAHAQHDRFSELLRRSGLSREQHLAVLGSPAFGPLSAALRRAEAHHHDLERLVRRVVAQHGLDDAIDIAAVLRHRIDRAAASPPWSHRNTPPRLIAGLIPEPLGAMEDEDRSALLERQELIERRAAALAVQAANSGAPWVSALGDAPTSPEAWQGWFASLVTIAAYRDRYGVKSRRPAGRPATSDAQRMERRRALRAVNHARILTACQAARPSHLTAETLRWTSPHA